MDDVHSPPSADFMQWLQNERERRSPSPSPPVPRNTLFGANRERRSLPNRSRWNRNRSRDEDRGLRHILEMSRMEYEADQRLNKGGYIIHHTNTGEKEGGKRDRERWGEREGGRGEQGD